MKSKKKLSQVLRAIYKWLMIALCGISVAIWVAAVFYKLFSRVEGLTIFAIVLMLAVVALLWWRIRAKNRRSKPTPRKNATWRKCEKCGAPLRAFHYYRDNACVTYCEKCGNAHQAAHAAPYRTIELHFSGIQRDGSSLTVEVENWPSLERCYLRWCEWNKTGGSDVKVDLPENYLAEHTVEEFMAEYLLKANDVTKRVPFSVLEGSLQSITNRLLESGVFYTHGENSTASDVLNALWEKKLAPVFIPNLAGYQMKMHRDSGESYCFTLTGLKAYSPNMGNPCGSGSDEWCFHCKCGGENYILRFIDDAGYGTYWDCTLIDKESAEQLINLSATDWLKLQRKAVRNNPETRTGCLHPDTIDDAKKIVQATSSRCGPISDDGFYGN